MLRVLGLQMTDDRDVEASLAAVSYINMNVSVMLGRSKLLSTTDSKQKSCRFYG